MNPVGFVYHPDFLRHETGAGHPERPERLQAISDHLRSNGMWDQMNHIEPKCAERAWIELCHPPEYVDLIQTKCESGIQLLDGGDTVVGKDSFRIATLAAGAAMRAVDEVCANTQNANRAFSAVRPPGHHAETSKAMGFCLLNNVAIAARYAQRQYGIERVAIVDWDVHHGNGTQEIFWSDPSVLYVSLHQYPLWPGSGAAGERGEGAGEGYTLNSPMPPGSGEKEYLAEFRSKILPSLKNFAPELLLISAGFDAHKDDPLANIRLTEQSFAKLTEMVREVAELHCAGRIVSVLEGGYNLQALALSVETHLRMLMQ
jgi:acetoin utilization deacetylase AcuC-like enzyme